MQVDLWGVRGGIAGSGPHNNQFGGNTPCISVQASDETLLVLDAGTGIRALGQKLIGERHSGVIHLLLSHFHWDHVQGLPFFAPLWEPGIRIEIYAGYPPSEIERAVRDQFAAPYFPVGIEQAPAQITYHDVRTIQHIGDVQIRSFPQHHPQGSTGFRLQDETGSVVYATDSEGGVQAADTALLAHAQEASLLLLDAQYTPEESPQRRGWGHGDWARACSVAKAAKVRNLILFHHDPARTDDQLTHIEQQAQQLFAKTEAACEGTSFRL